MYTKLSKTREFIKDEIAKIEADERYHYKPALVEVNAPLALIQVEMGSRMQTLKEIEAILDNS